MQQITGWRVVAWLLFGVLPVAVHVAVLVQDRVMRGGF